MIPWIVLAALIAVYCITLPALTARYGKSSPLAYVPLIQFLPFLKMIGRPWWWIILLLVPGVNLIMLAIINVELGIVFNQRSTKDQWFFGALPWVALPQLAFQKKEASYKGPRDWSNTKKSFLREWGEAILFAIVAASVIRTFIMEAFTIPTPSMEKSMLVGDYLFVSKMSYGPKVPQTPVSLPFVHNAMPGSMANSYVEWFSLPYFRLPGFGKVERFDPVVFNFPNGDTILVDPFYAGHDYYSFLRNESIIEAGGNMRKFLDNPEPYETKARANFAKGKCQSCAGTGHGARIEGVRHRPIDKKENYVKRCIGLPGDNLKIVDRQVYINDAPIENPKEMQFNYHVKFNNVAAFKSACKEFSVNIEDRKNGYFDEKEPVYILPLTIEEYEQLKANTSVVSIEVDNDTLGSAAPFSLYPNSVEAPFDLWTKDNYGPIHIPAKGETIELTKENVALYRRVITAYEGHSMTSENGQVLIDGKPATSYTFQQDYYWMMGDNRHQSLDSRFWGFVPDDHIVGKPVFVWFSKSNLQYQEDTSIRWKRMFRLVD